jgi:hypothetical protein
MLRAIPKGWLSSDYTVFENETAVAEVDLSFLTESSDIRIKEGIYKAYREGWASGAFVIESAGSILARAEKPSALYRSFIVEYGDRKYTLEAESALLRKFILMEEAEKIGSIYPDHAFTSRAMIELPEEIPLPVRIFMFWLVVILWKRDSDSAVVVAATT